MGFRNSGATPRNRHIFWFASFRKRYENIKEIIEMLCVYREEYTAFKVNMILQIKLDSLQIHPDTHTGILSFLDC
jgi:hypothetical protein